MRDKSSETEKPTARSLPPAPQRFLIANLEPIRILQTVSAGDFETLIMEWQQEYLRKEYSRVERLGGTSDKGRDVVCTCEDGTWINYQCKHYEHNILENQQQNLPIQCYYHYLFLLEQEF